MTERSTSHLAKEIWEKASSIIQSQVDGNTYRQWFSVMIPLEADEDSLLLGVGDEFFAEWVRDNYLDILSEAISHAAGHKMKALIEHGHHPETIEPEPESREESPERPVCEPVSAPNCNSPRTQATKTTAVW